MVTPAPSSPLPGISCVIPVYNEAGAVAETLRGVAAELGRFGRPFEILLVDDGSTDGTLKAAESAGVPFTPLRHELNRGYGAAIKTGSRRAVHPWILIIDADGTYPPAEIAKLLFSLGEDEEAEMIVGQRRQTLETDSFFRLQGKAILTSLASFLAGMRIPDLNSGLRLMRAAHLSRFRPLLPDGFSLTTSITLALLCSGAFVRYVPIEYRPRKGESKIRPLRDMWNFTVLILRTITYFNPLKVFAPLAGLFVVASVVVAVTTKILYDRVMDITTLFLFMAGLQMLLIGVVADLMLKLSGMREK